LEQRIHLIAALKKAGVQAFFHYPPLHLSRYHLQTHKPKPLPNAIKFFEQVTRLPLYVDLSRVDQDHVIAAVRSALPDLPIKKS